MSESYPCTATNNIRFDPTYFDTTSRRENELPNELSGPSLATFQSKPIFPEDHVQLDASVRYQDELLGADEWILVDTKAPAENDLEMPVEESKQLPRQFSF